MNTQNTYTTSHQGGLTLIEVLIAVALIAIGILAALAMQTTALQTTSRMTVTQTLTQVAFTELDFQRSIFTATQEPSAGSCNARMPDGLEAAGYDCEVIVEDCEITSAGAVCGGAVTSDEPNAFLVRISASRASGEEMSLSRVLGERTYFEDDE